MPIGLVLLIALVQGLTEFLPVSSSGHLALIPILTDIPYQSQTMDVAAHVGTFLAVTIYLRHDIIEIIRSAFGLKHETSEQLNAQLGLMLLGATLPVAVIGYFVNYANWHWLALVTTMAWANIIFAGLLWASDRLCAQNMSLQQMRWPAAITIGIMQVFALIPGASRSGTTMTAARFLGYNRVTAARFSLLLSLPTIAGAGLLKALDLVNTNDPELGLSVALVALFSAIFAWLAIRVMVAWLARSSFTIFVWYRLALGGILLFALNQGWIVNSISTAS